MKTRAIMFYWEDYDHANSYTDILIFDEKEIQKYVRNYIAEKDMPFPKPNRLFPKPLNTFSFPSTFNSYSCSLEKWQRKFIKDQIRDYSIDDAEDVTELEELLEWLPSNVFTGSDAAIEINIIKWKEVDDQLVVQFNCDIYDHEYGNDVTESSVDLELTFNLSDIRP